MFVVICCRIWDRQYSDWVEIRVWLYVHLIWCGTMQWCCILLSPTGYKTCSNLLVRLLSSHSPSLDSHLHNYLCVLAFKCSWSMYLGVPPIENISLTKVYVCNLITYNSAGCLEEIDSTRRIFQLMEGLHSLLCPSWPAYCTHFYFFGTAAQIIL